MAEGRRVRADDGVELQVAVGGRGPALVLCHGGPGMWDYFDSLRPALEDAVSVITWDQRGCGRSPAEGPHSVDRYVEDLDVIRGALGLESWVVGGHSWGATLALMYALARPERTSAVVYMSGTGLGRAWNPAYHQEQDRRRRPYRARIDELEARERCPAEEAELRRLWWRSDLADELMVDVAAEALDRPYPVNRVANAAINAEVKTWSERNQVARCRRLDIPVLVLHGSRDPRPAWGLDSLVAALPNAWRFVLADVGHLPWLEAPERTTTVLREFLGAATTSNRLSKR